MLFMSRTGGAARESEGSRNRSRVTIVALVGTDRALTLTRQLGTEYKDPQTAESRLIEPRRRIE